MYIEKSSGPRIEPCGTPFLIGFGCHWEWFKDGYAL